MVRFFRESGLPSRRVREAARQRRRSDRASDLKIESLEPRLALAVMPVLADNKPPEAVSVALPAAGTYGTGSNLTFKVRFSEPVKVVGSPGMTASASRGSSDSSFRSLARSLRRRR